MNGSDKASDARRQAALKRRESGLRAVGAMLGMLAAAMVGGPMMLRALDPAPMPTAVQGEADQTSREAASPAEALTREAEASPRPDQLDEKGEGEVVGRPVSSPPQQSEGAP